MSPSRLNVCAALLAVLALPQLKAKGQAQKQRDAAYESTVESYAKALTPGMTRNEVERYLRGKNAQFQQTCCFEGRHTPDDLVKIGKETAPWYCSRTNVYVTFAFIGEQRHPSSKALDSDTLAKVSLLRWPEDCL